MGIRIGVIGAMDIEIAHLKERMASEARSAGGAGAVGDASLEETTRAGMTFYSGTIGGTPVVVSMCKVGKVNAAACTQMMCDIFGVTHIVNTGAAGSLDARIDIGDFVVSTDAVQHDMDVCNFGYEPGQVPGLDTVAFAADSELRQMAVAAIEEAAPEVKAFEGRVLSGDQFVRDQDVKHRIKATFGGLCCEMEGAAIAQVAHLNDVPFVVVRAISDKADGSDSQLYEEFERKAAEHSALIVEHMLSRMQG